MPSYFNRLCTLIIIAWIATLPDGVKAAGQTATSTDQRPRLVAQLGHFFSIVSMAVSPDGKLLATGGQDGWVIVWDAATLNELYRMRDTAPDADGSEVDAIQFSPDQRFVAAQCGELIMGNAKSHVWEIVTGRELRFKSPEGETLKGQIIRFAPDSKSCILRDAGRLWHCNLESPDRCRDLSDAFEYFSASDFVISPDGSWMVLGSEGGRSEIVSLPNAKLLRELKWPVKSAASADNKSTDSTQKTKTPEKKESHGLFSLLFGSKDSDSSKSAEAEQESLPAITALAVSTNSKTVALGTVDGRLGLFAADTGKNLLVRQLPNEIVQIRFSPDGKSLVVQTRLTFQVMDAGKGEVQAVYRTTQIPWTVKVSPDGKHLLTAGQDRRVRMWDVETGRLERAFEGPKDQLYLATVIADGKQIQAYDSNGEPYRWNSQTGETARIEPRVFQDGESAPVGLPSDPIDHSRRERNLLWLQFAWPISSSTNNPVMSSNGIWVSSSDSTEIVSTSNLNEHGSVTKPPENSANVMNSPPAIRAISNDGKFVLLSTLNSAAGNVNSSAVEVWSLVSGKHISRLADRETFLLAVAAFSDDNTWVATADSLGAIKIWGAANGRLYGRLSGASGQITSLAFTAGAKQVIAGSLDGTAYVWDRASGKLLRRFEGHERGITSIALSPDSKYLFTAGADETARRWDLETGKELTRYYEADHPSVAAVYFGKQNEIIVLQKDCKVRISGGEGGKALREFSTQPSGELLSAHAMSDDGQQLYVAGMKVKDLDCSPDLTEELMLSGMGNMRTYIARCEAETGSIDVTVQSPQAAANVLVCPIDTLALLTGNADEKVRVWDGDGVHERTSKSTANSGYPLVLFPDKQHMVVATDIGKGKADVRNIRTGEVQYSLPEVAVDVLLDAVLEFTGQTAHFVSPDGKRLLWPANAGAAAINILDASNGAVQKTLTGHSDVIWNSAFSPDGKWVATASEDGTVCLWNPATGQLAKRLKGHTGPVYSLAWYPTSGWLASGGDDGQVILWSIPNGAISHRFKMQPTRDDWGTDDDSIAPRAPAPPASAEEEQNQAMQGVHLHAIRELRFTTDGRSLLTRTDRGNRSRLEFWDTSSGKELISAFSAPRVVPKNPADASPMVKVSKTALSSDGKRLLGWDRTNSEALLWDTASGKLLYRLGGNAPGVTAAGFLNNGNLIYTCSVDGRTKLWNAEKGTELCTLIAFVGGGWAVVDPQGRFDASNGGDLAGLHWVVGSEPIDLVQLKDRYFEPGLLAKILGVNKEPLRNVQTLNHPKLFPAVAGTTPKPGETKFNVQLENRGGGIGRVVVLVNGKQFDLPEGIRGAKSDPNATTLNLPIDLTGDPRLIPGGRNKIEVQAYNAEGYLRSRGLELEIDDPRPKDTAVPNVWAVVAGTAHYQGGKIDLAYPAKDAEDFAAGLQIAAGALFGPENVHLTLLTSPNADAPNQPDDAHRTTRANLVRAFETLSDPQRVKPGDILAVYLAGHGVARGGSDDSFYYLTCDAQNAQLDDSELRKQWTISDRELTEWLHKSPARKQVMILDTCQSGKVVEDLMLKREISSSQERALQRVKDSTGFYILAGCAADKASYEASRYGQGVLTYALLFGMRGAALKEDQFVDVQRLFDFAKEEVPHLAGDIGGIQQPVIASPKGSTFLLGQLTKEDQTKIPLQATRPLVLRTIFHDDTELDPLDLSGKLDELLREVAASRGAHSTLAFVDARQSPGAYHLTGRYQLDGDKVSVDVRLTPPEGATIKFQIAGEKTNVAELASKICEQVQQRIAGAAVKDKP